MNDFMKWCFKLVFNAILWVFILSINWNGRTMFSYAHATLVDNAVVRAFDEQLAVMWSKVSRAAKTAFSEDANLPQPADRKS